VGSGRRPSHTAQRAHHTAQPRATHVIPTFTSGTARSASASEVTAICAATAHTLDTAARKMTFGANHDSSAGERVKVEEEEEETLGQLRDRQVLAAARAAVPGPRAPFVHIKVEDSTSGDDTDGEGSGGDGQEATTGGKGDGEGEKVKEEGAAEEEAEEEGAEPRDLRAHESSATLKGDSEGVRSQRLALRAHSEPGSPQVPGTYADNAVRDDAVLDDDDREEEAGIVPELVMRGGAGRTDFSRFQGVWDKHAIKWRANCKKYLGLHTTEEAASHAYNKYLVDGIVPEPAEHGGWGTSLVKGVYWDMYKSKWRVDCKGTKLGSYTTEVEAERAYITYLEDGIDPVTRREPSTSQFTGVSWVKVNNKWKATCKGNYLGCHIAQKDAAQAYNVEVARRGLPLNVILSVGAAGASDGACTGAGASADAGNKRATPETPAATATNEKKTMRAAPTTPAAPATGKNVQL
jgi:hypothetical protein